MPTEPTNPLDFPPLDGMSRLAGVRVLLAEDNKINQKVAAKMLDQLGCEVEIVGDGLEALKKWEEAKFDVILMDVRMPRMDGYRATAEIRRREQAQAGGPHLPIIAMTAHAMQGDRERCLAAQMDDYLSKPVALAELAQALGRWATQPRTTPDPIPRPALRISRLRELSQGEVEFERELLECLLTDIASGMDRLRVALDPLDPLQVANTLHGIVGSCRTVGADDLGACCAAREREANLAGFRPDAAWLAAIERKHDALISAITTHLTA